MIGRNRPVFSYTVPPNPLQYNTRSSQLHGHLALHDGTPIAGAKLAFSADADNCGNVRPYARMAAVTNAFGDVTVTVPLAGPPQRTCIQITVGPGEPETFLSYNEFRPVLSVRLTASVNTTSVRLGRFVDVSGSLTPATPCGEVDATTDRGGPYPHGKVPYTFKIIGHHVSLRVIWQVAYTMNESALPAGMQRYGDYPEFIRQGSDLTFPPVSRRGARLWAEPSLP